MAALEDRPHSVRPHIYDAIQRAVDLAAALTDLKELSRPFA
jgi:hypothetical protein